MRIRNKRKTMNEYGWCWLVFTCCHFTRRIDKNKGRICNVFAFRAHTYVYPTAFQLWENSIIQSYLFWWHGHYFWCSQALYSVPNRSQKYSRLLISTGNSRYTFFYHFFISLDFHFISLRICIEFVEYVSKKITINKREKSFLFYITYTCAHFRKKFIIF